MSRLIKLENKKITADSRIIAEGFLSTNKSILNLIRSHEDGLKKFGKVTFQKASTKSGQTQTFVELNEPQTMLLLTYTRSNESTDKFREDLVNEFFLMREKLKKLETIQLATKQVRKSLTDAVQESGENDRMHGRGYSNYTRMVYDICGLKPMYSEWLGFAKKEFPNFREWIDIEDLKRVELAESLIKPLLELDKQYSEIKETLKPLFEPKRIK